MASNKLISNCKVSASLATLAILYRHDWLMACLALISGMRIHRFRSSNPFKNLKHFICGAEF